MSDKFFIDSNVVLYLLSAEPEKANAAEKAISSNAIISVQVLNEVTNVARKKLALKWDEITEFIAVIRSVCTVVPLTLQMHGKARQLAEQYQISFYDACIVAAAIEAKCKTLLTEDLQDGLIIEKVLTIQNPFTVR